MELEGTKGWFISAENLLRAATTVGAIGLAVMVYESVHDDPAAKVVTDKSCYEGSSFAEADPGFWVYSADKDPNLVATGIPHIEGKTTVIAADPNDKNAFIFKCLAPNEAP